MTLYLSRLDKTNLGDWLSRPSLYFDWMDEGISEDLNALVDGFGGPLMPRANALGRGADVIVGGGGVFGQNPDWDRVLDVVLRSGPRTSVCWGAGLHPWDKTSLHAMATFGASAHKWVDGVLQWPKYLSLFDLVGIRDDVGDELLSAHANWRWVPCASCLHPAFDALVDVSPAHDFVIYEHADQVRWRGRYQPEVSAPRMDNRRDNPLEVLTFLASGRTVLTDSYHGAYWASLLGRRVVVVGAFSSKFSLMRHAPAIVSFETPALDAVDAAVAHSGALIECRRANHEFAASVRRLQATGRT